MDHTFSRAILRRPSSAMDAGLTTAALGPPDPGLAAEQFDRYVEALAACGLAIEILEALPGFPDAHFVEDVAVVLPELAVLTRPGATQRRDEVEGMEGALAAHRPLHRIVAPGRIDGGDVLVAGDRVLIGLSARTDEEGARQLGAIVEQHGLSWRTVPVGAGLHLKSSVNPVGEQMLLVTEELAALPELADFDLLVVPGGESFAANVLLVNGHLLVPAGFPSTQALLEPLGHEIVILNMSEFRKMDGGLSCLSLRF